MRRAALFVLMITWCVALPLSAAAQDPHAGHAPPPPAKPQAPAKPQPGAKPAPGPNAQPVEDHPAHATAGATPDAAAQQPQEPIPPLTDADRAAAFPPALGGHAVHDSAINYLFLFDQVEWQGAGGGGPSWENISWIGGDRNRLWIRTEGESTNGDLENAFVDVLFGRAIARWWDWVAGVRHDFSPGPQRTWVGGGIQGLAPYWFEIEATGYVGEGGRTHARFEVEYELLMTNRLILQPLVEAELYGSSDAARGLGAGLSAVETGLRLRYELKREFAPYLGVTWNRKMFGTAGFARAAGDGVSGVRLAVGLRTWF